MRSPSIKTLTETLSITTKQAEEIRSIIKMSYSNAISIEQSLNGIDVILGSHGLGYVPSKKDKATRPYGLSYYNSGDPYIPTIVFDWHTLSWRVGCIGNIIEKRPNRYK